MLEVKRIFHHSIYNKAALEETKMAYGELLDTTFKDDANLTEAEFTTDDENGAMFVDAFCNHALFLTIQEHRQGTPE